MKFIMSIMLIGIINCSFSTKTTYINEVIGIETVMLRPIVIEFSFDQNGCTYTVFAAIETDTGAAGGYIQQNCNGKKVKKWFKIYGATLAKSITVSNFYDWEDEDGNATNPFDLPIVQKAADGMNENWPE